MRYNQFSNVVFRVVLLITVLTASACGIFKKKDSPVLTSSSPVAKPIENHNGYKNGLVVTAHPIASEIGVQILKKGGNAIDAAVAVQFVLAVVYPNAGNLGGGGFMVYRSAKGEKTSLDFRETAPSEASENMYLDMYGQPIADLSLQGQLASGVPGTVDGMEKAHKRYGKLPWKDIIQPAITLARSGFKITEMQASELNANRDEFLKYNPEGTPFTSQGKWNAGAVLVQSDLASTLELIRDGGRAGFYEGVTANKLVAEMQSGNGLINLEDLKNYEAKWRTPVEGTYHNYNVISMPPPSSGGIALLQLLKSVEGFPLKKWGFQRDSTVQLIIEAERRVYADRATHLGDPDFYKVPQSQLVNPKYNAIRMSDVNFQQATPSSSIKAGGLVVPESEQTTHFSIVDREGNAVSLTTTLNASYGSMVMVKGAGFLLNNEMDDFSVKPGAPNMYGLIGGVANRIEPGKRMLSSMTPTILEKDGKLFMVLGTPGGSTIITSVFQTILNVVDWDMNIQDAVNASRFHHQWLPDYVSAEKDALSLNLRTRLLEKGYKIVNRNAIGRVDAILVSPEGLLFGGADPRGDDRASGY